MTRISKKKHPLWCQLQIYHLYTEDVKMAHKRLLLNITITLSANVK